MGVMTSLQNLVRLMTGSSTLKNIFSSLGTTSYKNSSSL